MFVGQFLCMRFWPFRSSISHAWILSEMEVGPLKLRLPLLTSGYGGRTYECLERMVGGLVV